MAAGFSTDIAKSAATSARCVVRIWSMRRWPVVGAAVSESTTSEMAQPRPRSMVADNVCFQALAKHTSTADIRREADFSRERQHRCRYRTGSFGLRTFRADIQAGA